MPRERMMPGMEADAPKEPHLLLYTQLGPEPVASALPLGCNIGVVAKPGEWAHVARMVLIEVHAKSLVFQCACGPRCQVRFTYTLRETGHHQRR